MEQIPNNVGVFPLYNKSAEDFILSLASWAHDNKTSQQSVLLLLDDLEAASNLDFDARQNLRWLLLRGPARRVWPILTLNPNRMENIMPWLDAFHTRIFGTMQNPRHISQLDAVSARAGVSPQRFTLYLKRRRPLASILVTKHRLIDKELNMHTGMLWFDNSQTALNIKIQKAVDYYHKKYGRTPDLCLVHPSMLDTQDQSTYTCESQQVNCPPLPACSTGPHLDWHRGQKLDRSAGNCPKSCPLHLPQNWPAGGFL